MNKEIIIFLKGWLVPFYQDLFIIESFELLNESGIKDMRVTYRFTGRRKVTMTKKLGEICIDKKLLNCFSREDVYELGLWFGRLKEINNFIANKD